MIRAIYSVVFAAFAALMLSACGQGDVLFVDDAVVTLSPVEGNPAVGHLTLHGGRQDVELVAVTADDVLRMEMHETLESDGMMSMEQINNVPVPAGETVKFESGGKHLMIWGVGERSIKRGLLTMTFVFSNDERIELDAVVRKPGAPAAGSEESGE